MLRSTYAIACTLAATLVCGAQAPSTDTGSAKHFRITFAISYVGSPQPSQSFSIEVPVSSDRPGVATANLGSALAGDTSPQTVAVQFTDIHESSNGLGLKISMTSDSESRVAGIDEPVHHHGVFDRQVDLALDKPTVVTNEMHLIPLGKTDMATARAVAPPAPQITVTVSRI